MKTSNKFLCALCATLVFLSGAAQSAEIVVVNFDDPGVGFNDPTPAAPVGGNPGTTLGEQRMIVFEQAAAIWGSWLKSTQPIYLAAFFAPLACDATSGVLGSAGPASVFASFPDLPLADTWYVGALADALSREDLDPGFVDMVARFNGDIGVNPNCLPDLSWYNGLDNNADAATEVDLLTVVMHEMAHGLGFLDLASESTGQFFGSDDPANPIPFLPDVYLTNMFDLDLDLSWEDLTDAQRLASQANSNRLVWTGDVVTQYAQWVLDARFSVLVQEPSPFAGSYEAQPATFGPQIAEGDSGLIGNLKNAQDGVGVGTDGCEPITNNVRHRIAIIDRGTCTFTQKVANAQTAGAKGVIIINNGPGLPPMGGDDPTITITSVGISQADGELFRTAVTDPPTQVKIRYDRNFASGLSEGYVRLYAPSPVQPGSSKSHFDVSANPNLLMEPFINSDLVPIDFLDLTPRVFKDIGWNLLPQQ
jgi:hypothetical protein